MCGILGWMTTKKSEMSFKDYKRGIKELLLLSETRGKEASGICCVSETDIEIVKADVRASKLVQSSVYERCMASLKSSGERLVMGHTRMVTNGDAANFANNQPVVRNDIIVIHNGIIVNSEEIWNKHIDLKREAQVDTEVFPALMEKYRYRDNVIFALMQTLGEVEGSLTIAMIDRKSKWLLLYTNIGSLYIAYTKNGSDIIFGSERYILEQTLRKHKEDIKVLPNSIMQIGAGNGVVINLSNGAIKQFSAVEQDVQIKQANVKRAIRVSGYRGNKSPQIEYILKDEQSAEIKRLLEVDRNKIHKLKRCTKCLLPETFPGIKFDDRGVQHM